MDHGPDAGRGARRVSPSSILKLIEDAHVAALDPSGLFMRDYLTELEQAEKLVAYRLKYDPPCRRQKRG
jgi:hypothetical protein